MDPRLPDPDEVAVSVDDGIVTLRGTVGCSASAERPSRMPARSKASTRSSTSSRPGGSMTPAARTQTSAASRSLQILMWDTEVPADLIDLKVHSGWVTPKGDVSVQFESDAAYDDVADLYGVVGVTNEIRVITP